MTPTVSYLKISTTQKMNRLIFSLIVVTSFLTACQNADNSRPVARVYDKYLYESDLQNIFLTNVSREDSILIAKAYIEKWIQTQLLLKQAENNLTEKEKNVARQLEDYRASLLIHKYEQAYVNQKLDTLVKESEVEQYYYSNKDNFVLSEPIVKALFIKLRKEAPQTPKIKEIYRSKKQEDIQLLDNLAYQAAIFYDFFNDQWIPFSVIARQLPYSIDDIKQAFSRQYIEMEDGSFIYLVSLRETKEQGETAPLSYITNEIKQLIINARKQNLIDQLERNLFIKAKDDRNFEIYK